MVSVSVLDALREIGVVLIDIQRPQQIKCPFHGNGQELQPSARVYPDTNSLYCWRCHRSWTSQQVLYEFYGVPYNGTGSKPGHSRLDFSMAQVLESSSTFPMSKRLMFLQELDPVLTQAASGSPISEVLYQIGKLRRKWWKELFDE